jgi:hypothetical protein
MRVTHLVRTPSRLDYRPRPVTVAAGGGFERLFVVCSSARLLVCSSIGVCFAPVLIVARSIGVRFAPLLGPDTG